VLCKILYYLVKLLLELGVRKFLASRTQAHENRPRKDPRPLKMMKTSLFKGLKSRSAKDVSSEKGKGLLVRSLRKSKRKNPGRRTKRKE
jgi:hypothetical protein